MQYWILSVIYVTLPQPCEFVMEKPFNRIGTRLSISEILGNVVTLSDYSSFAVRLLDRWKLWLWSPEQNVVVTENSNQKNPFKLSNSDISFGKIVSVKILTHGVPPEIPDDVAYVLINCFSDNLFITITPASGFNIYKNLVMILSISSNLYSRWMKS